MYYSDLEKYFKNYKNGRFMSISYKTNLPIKAQFKNKVTIIKFIDEVGRTGIYYPNIKNVMLSNKKVCNNKKWLITNIIYENTNNSEKYLRLTNLKKGSNMHINYIVKVGTNTQFFKDTLPDEYKHYVISSYYRKNNSNNNIIKDINISNIFSLK